MHNCGIVHIQDLNFSEMQLRLTKHTAYLCIAHPPSPEPLLSLPAIAVLDRPNVVVILYCTHPDNAQICSFIRQLSRPRKPACTIVELCIRHCLLQCQKAAIRELQPLAHAILCACALGPTCKIQVFTIYPLEEYRQCLCLVIHPSFFITHWLTASILHQPTYTSVSVKLD